MSIKQQLNRLIKRDKDNAALPDVADPAVIAARVGSASSGASPSSGGGGGEGIDSPLSEISRTTVNFEVFDDFNVWSTVEIHTTILDMQDASGRDVQFRMIDPNTGQLP